MVGVLAIEDPVREEAPAVLTALAGQGMKGPTMLTGDDDRTARAVAARLGIADFRAGLLPVDKARLVERLQSAGCRVLFVGDGINDAPALSASHVGVSLRDGADLAKEIAGVVLMDGRLSDLLVARMLAANAMTRVRRQFGFIMGVNSVLMALGLAGVISPRLAALLHNLTTVGATANSLRPLLPGPAAEASAMPSGPATARGARTGASADREPAAMTAAAFGDGA